MAINKALIRTDLETYKMREDFVRHVGSVPVGTPVDAATDVCAVRLRARKRRQARLQWDEARDAAYAAHGNLVFRVRPSAAAGGGAPEAVADVSALLAAAGAPDCVSGHVHTAGDASLTTQAHASIALLTPELLLVCSRSGSLLLLTLSPAASPDAAAVGSRLLRRGTDGGAWGVPAQNAVAPALLGAAAEVGEGGAVRVTAAVTFHESKRVEEGAACGRRVGAWYVVHHTTLLSLGCGGGEVEGVDGEGDGAEVDVVHTVTTEAGEVGGCLVASERVALLVPRPAEDGTADEAPAYDLRSYAVRETDGVPAWEALAADVGSLTPLWADGHSEVVAAAFDVDLALCTVEFPDGAAVAAAAVSSTAQEEPPASAAPSTSLQHVAHVQGMRLVALSREATRQLVFSRPTLRWTFLLEADAFTVFAVREGATIGDECIVRVPGLSTLVAVETDSGCDVVAVTETAVHMFHVEQPSDRPVPTCEDSERARRIAAALSSGGEW